MRIGTWNLAGGWSSDHRDLLLGLDCDVLLLTEVANATALPGYHIHPTEASMASGRRWAAVSARGPLRPGPDPHPASALAEVDGWTICSSVLPWRSSGSDPWGTGSHADRTSRALATLARTLPRRRFIWGGDWDLALPGPETSGSWAGRAALVQMLKTLGLVAPTRDLPHALAGLATIDHVAVPRDAVVLVADRVSASRSLSDHDAYVVEIVESAAVAD